MTNFRAALVHIEFALGATYRGSATVREMSQDSIIDAIQWGNESPDRVYHRFETKVGPDKIIADDQILKVAKHYSA